MELLTMIYIAILAPILILGAWSIFEPRTSMVRRPVFALSLLLLLIFAAIRTDTGTDFGTYSYFWELIGPLFSPGWVPWELDYLEPGFLVFMGMLKGISSSQVLFFSAVAILTIVPIYFGLVRLPFVNVYVASLLFFLTFYIPYSFNGLRQGVAMSLFVFALPFICERKFVATLVISALAASFHFSGWLILIGYGIARFPLSVFGFFVVTVGSAALFHITSATHAILELFVPHKLENYKYYFPEGLSVGNVITRIPYLIMFLMVQRRLHLRMYDRILKIYIAGFAIYLAFFDFGMVATRFNMFFRILEIALIPMAIGALQSQKEKLQIFVLGVGIAFYSFYVNITWPDNFYKFTHF